MKLLLDSSVLVAAASGFYGLKRPYGIWGQIAAKGLCKHRERHRHLPPEALVSVSLEGSLRYGPSRR